MSFTLTERQVKNFHKKIRESSTKKEIDEIFIKYFPEAFKSESPSKTSNDSDTEKKKSLKKDSDKKSEGVEKKSEYKIISVSNDYKYPSSKYNKDTPIQAAKSAMQAIIRKNKLKKEDDFTFTIQDKDSPKYTYVVRSGNLERAKA